MSSVDEEEIEIDNEEYGGDKDELEESPGQISSQGNSFDFISTIYYRSAYIVRSTDPSRPFNFVGSIGRNENFGSTGRRSNTETVYSKSLRTNLKWTSQGQLRNALVLTRVDVLIRILEIVHNAVGIAHRT